MVLSLFASLFVLLVINVGTTRNLFAARFIWLYLLVALVATALMIWLTKSYQIIIRHLVVRDIVVFAGVALGKVGVACCGDSEQRESRGQKAFKVHG